MQKKVQLLNKGMQRDLSVSKASSEYAYENKNIRIMPTDESTLLSVINEKGNKGTTIQGIGENLVGTPIGQSIINDELVVFTAGDSSFLETGDILATEELITDISALESTLDIDTLGEDRIYKLWFNNSVLTGTRLYRGQLGFNYKYPIEALSFYENSNLKKVYWTDSLNQPRVINIAATSSTINSWKDTSFDFVRELKLKEQISIKRNLVASGVFAPGIIQYCFSYFNRYGQESNIFYTSPLLYTSYNNSGASPEDSVGNSFTISISNMDSAFDCVRVYSIHRTSLDATPTVKKVVDLSIISSTINYTDNGTVGDTMDPTELLYIGGEEVVFSTMTQKDNVLFLGNIELKRKVLSTPIKSFFENKSITFSTNNKKLDTPAPNGVYPYSNQLNLDSYQIKSFKYLETYRFGVQFQHKTGKWSETIWVNDVRNTVPLDIPYAKSGEVIYPTAKFVLDDITIIQTLLEEGYIKVRPVVVYPELSDRECVCQGILCPTVFNIEDRYNNSPTSQASWFTRANEAFSISDVYTNMDFRDRDTGIGDIWDGTQESIPSLNGSINSRSCIIRNDSLGYGSGDSATIKFDIIPKGSAVANIHHERIPGTGYTDDNGEYIATRGGEIQCVTNPPSSPVVTYSNDNDVYNWVSTNSDVFYVDQSILTLHSPDIEFNTDVRSVDSSKLKLRIVGMVPISASVSDIDIQTSTLPNNYKNTTDLAPGFYKEGIGSTNFSRFGHKALVSGAFWFDSLSSNSTEGSPQGFAVYPWHRNGSLNETKEASSEGYKSAMLDKKKMSVLRFSYNSFYFPPDTVWNAYIPESTTRQGISGISIFDSNETTLIKIPAPSNSGLQDISYYGNIDKIITPSLIGDNSSGYPIVTTGYGEVAESSHLIFVGAYQTITSGNEIITGIDPVSMKYKSTPHAVIALNYSSRNYQRVLPTLYDGDVDIDMGILFTEKWTINNVNATFGTQQKLFWEKERTTLGVSQDAIDYNFNSINGSYNGYGPEYGYLWIGELYNDELDTSVRFGGQTESAFEDNVWLPCGEAIHLIDDIEGVKSSIEIEWTEGDTYYQRYDHLKTYPFTLEDQNSVVDIISFMCETRVNLDGRYDKNRGQSSNLVMTPTNFNLMNDVYSQQNNFFNYRGIDSNTLNLDNFYNSLTWTTTKTAGELIDTWTNITLASTLDLDGDKGNINSLQRYNNEIIAFQDKGISNILFNSRTQLAVNEGLPVEIANSGKVDGKVYLSDNIGCSNKWSICETPNGIYFIDNITKGIYLFNGKLFNLSDKLGFHSWINAKSNSINIWNPIDFKGFVTYYDKINGDIFFISKEECLAYSETLGQFTSFYSYESMPYFINLEDRGISFNTSKKSTSYKAWLHNEGDYNMFFDSYQPFYTTMIANPDMTSDKIFNNLEFRADSWDKNSELLNTTFDKLYTWNEYQSGESKLNNVLGRPSDLKKKFRVWRANIPRSKSNGRDRMRNPWLYIKLAMEEENTNKTLLHDMVVNYFD